MDRRGVLKHAEVLGACFLASATHVEIDAVVDHRLWKWRGLNQEEPVIVRRGELLRYAMKKFIRGHDIKNGELGNAIRVVKRHAVTDPASAIVSDQHEVFKTE